MSFFKPFAALILALTVSACGTTDFASRNAPFEVLPQTAPTSLPTYNVRNINVTVPRSLSVSEANSYLPKADIVWRGDPLGDRYEQIEAIFKDAMTRGTQDMNGLVKVDLDIEIVKFHALTEKTRYSVGGVHAITFALSVRDVATGMALDERRLVEADLVGFGGRRAIEADAKGQTQKVRITAHLANVIRTELETPNGYQNEKLGVIQAMNRF